MKILVGREGREVAALNAFSDLIHLSSGITLQAANLRRHQLNDWVVRLDEHSICMALVLLRKSEVRRM